MTKRNIIIVVLIVVAIGGVAWQIKSHKGADQGSKPNSNQTALKPAIDGEMVAENLANRRPIAVMIENHPDSRPQSGLSEADVVYETLAEGGITRHMALFQTQEPESIGPIRSTRPYFNFLASQWAAILVHAGGSSDALQQLRSNAYPSVSDADQFFNDKYFQRSNDRFPPHNLYSSYKDLAQLAKDKKFAEWRPGNYWSFAAIPTDQLKTAVTSITIPFSTASYTVKYAYDSSTNTYKRSIGNIGVIDANNRAQISPKNVIVQFADSFAVQAATEGGIDFSLDSSGTIAVFTGGDVKTGTWKYQNGKISYYNKDGSSIMIQPGQTWIEIVPNQLKSQVTWQ
jgi:hypothetical protein